MDDENPTDPMQDVEEGQEPKAYGSNIIKIGEGTFEGEQTGGEEVDFAGRGMIEVKPDGSKCLKVTEIEGVPVMGEQEDPTKKRVDELKGMIKGRINEGYDDNE